MIPLAIVYVSDMQRSMAFYQALGGQVVSHSNYWTELRFGESRLALHFSGEPLTGNTTQVGLSFEAVEALEVSLERLRKAGIEPYREISDEAFGRSLVLQDPDGLRIQINEHDPELYPQTA